MKPTDISVVLDTSVIHKVDAETVIAPSIAKAIHDLPGNPAVTLRWFLPETVVSERIRQILAECVQAFGAAGRLAVKSQYVVH